MKKFIVMGTLALVAWSSIKADEPPASSSATGSSSMTSMTSTVTPVIRKKGVAAPSYRKFEIRAGPRVMMLNGDIRVGTGATPFDIWEDLGLDLPNAGAQFNLDWQPYSRFHILGEIAYDNYDQKGNTTKSINTGGGGPLTRTFATGSEVKANFHAFQFDGKLAYDAFRDETYRLQIHGGMKGVYTDGKLTMTGTTLTGTPIADETRLSEGFAVGTFGLDHKVYVVRGVYLGLDNDLSVWDDYFAINGELYVGWDITKNWGVRAGYDFTYLDYENPNKTTGFSPLVNAFYFQAVWGF